MKNKIMVLVLLLILLAIGSYIYITRPASAPSADINSKIESSTSTNSQAIKLTIDQAQSKAEFSLNEELRGVPTLIIGTTNQIAGEIIINTTNPSQSQIGQIVVNARTLKTDSEKRDGAIARLILKSEDPANEFIIFQPTNTTGLPTTAIAPNQELNFQITGNLTIKGVTKPVAFTAKAKLGTNNVLTGSAETTLTYADFGVSVPNFDFLANVDKTVKLKISLVAKP